MTGEPLSRKGPGDVSEALADLLTSGLCGRTLLNALFDQFGDAKRFEVFLGVAMAFSLFEARLTLAEMEVELLQRRRDGQDEAEPLEVAA
jgi:hypothetical protein